MILPLLTLKPVWPLQLYSVQLSGVSSKLNLALVLWPVIPFMVVCDFCPLRGIGRSITLGAMPGEVSKNAFISPKEAIHSSVFLRLSGNGL